MEEIRKIQLTGRSSFIISLPKKWIKDMGLKVGDQLVITQEGSSLIITPKDLIKPKVNLSEAIIKISKDYPLEKIIRAIISVYLNGYDPIRIMAIDGQITPSHKNTIRGLTKRKLIGVEIISDMPNEMILKVLVDSTELSISSTLRRMCLITSSLHENAIKALINLDKDLANNVIELDDEVDRLSFYIIRQLKVAVQNSKVMQEIGLSNPRECLAYRVLVKFVERIADHSVRIAEITTTLNSKFDESILDEIMKISSFSKSVFETSVEAFFKRDYQLAEENIQKIRETMIKGMKIIRDIIKRNKKQSAELALILENLRRIIDYSSDIAEIVLNLSIEQIIQT
jgi:phosphate uptake regulator